MNQTSLNIEKNNNIEPDNGLPKHLFSMASLSFDECCKFPRLFLRTHTYEGLRAICVSRNDCFTFLTQFISMFDILSNICYAVIPSNIMNPEIRSAVQDICCATLDIIGDWTYLAYLYSHASDIIDDDNQSQYMMFSHCVLAVSIYGTILSCWVVLLGLVNIRHHQLGGQDVSYASFDRSQWTVPRLAMWAMVFHHVPVFILTTRIDMSYFGDMTIAGWLNFGTSMLALLNSSFFTLRVCSGCCGDTSLCDNTVGESFSHDGDSKMNSSILDYTEMKPGGKI